MNLESLCNVKLNILNKMKLFKTHIDFLHKIEGGVNVIHMILHDMKGI